MNFPRAQSRISTASKRIWSFLALLAVGLTIEPGAGGRGAQPEVLVGSSCKAIRETGGVLSCVLNADGKMALWVAVPSCDAVRIEEDGRVVPAAGQLVREGCRFQFVASSSQQATTLAVAHAASGQSFWTLQLDHSRPELLDWTTRINQRADADLDGVGAEMRQRASQRDSTEQLMDFSLASAHSHQRRGPMDTALNEYRQAFEHAQRGGYSSVAIEAAKNIAIILWQFGGQNQEALGVLRQAKSLTPAANGKSRMYLAQVEATILRNQQQLAEALDLYRQVQLDAERLDEHEMLRRNTHFLGGILVELGWSDEARRLLGKLDQLVAGANDCEKARVLSNEGWLALALSTEASQPGTVLKAGLFSVAEVFLQALESRRRCVDSRFLANIYAGLAQTAFLELRLGDVPSWAAKARQEPGLALDDKLELLNVEARAALKGGRTDLARTLFESLEATSQKYPDFDRRSYECLAAMGMLESRPQDTKALEKVRSCLAPQSGGLAPAELRNLRRRAAALGI